MRSIVEAALIVCNVAKTRCPVSAEVTASDMVSRSLISPTSITSGLCLSTCFKASEIEHIRPEARDLRNAVGKIELLALFKYLL